MNIVRRLTLRHLQANKGRTVVTTLGICVSVAMITAVFVGIASILHMFGEVELGMDGNKQATFMGVTDEQYEKLCKESEISMVGCYSMETEMGFCLDDRTSDRVGVGDVYQGDEVNLKQMVTGSYEGTLPKNAGELAVEEDVIRKNHLDWKLGDTVTIPMGTRYTEENGERMVVEGSYVGGEQFEKTREHHFVITAILHKNFPTQFKGKLICGMDDKERGEYFGATITLSEVNYKSFEVIKDIIKQYGIKEYSIATTYLASHFAVSKDSSIFQSILPLTLVMLLIIMFASVMLIYNAFGMSLSERVRYLGMLASVGATARQKRASIYFEGALLGMVGIPVGILAGVTGISITLKIVFQKMLESGVIQEYQGVEEAIQMVVPLWSILAIVLVSMLTIYLSAMIPAKKASMITPIDAIRQNTELRIKSKNLYTPWYIRLLFGYEGELAHKSLKRNKRKTRTITVSLTLSVVLFLSVNYFCQMFVESNRIEQDVPYQIQVITTYSRKDSMLEEISKLEDVKACYGVKKWGQCYGKKAKDGIKKADLMNPENLSKKYQDLFDYSVMLYVNWIEDDKFEELIKKNGGDVSDYYGGELKAVVMNNISHKPKGEKVFTNKLLGKTITVDSGEGATIELHDFVEYDEDNYICELNNNRSISVYVPISMAREASKEQYGLSEEEESYMLGVTTKKHEAVTEDIQMLIEEKDYKHAIAMDFVESSKTMNTIIFTIQVFFNGFVALITFITLANIINTISTGIALRKKEFAMLKSVGVTPAGFSKMIRLESVFYGMRALIIGLPVSALISYLLYHIAQTTGMPFEVPLGLYFAVVAAVFLIVGLSMGYSLHRIKGDSIVETLKQEIS